MVAVTIPGGTWAGWENNSWSATIHSTMDRAFASGDGVPPQQQQPQPPRKKSNGISLRENLSSFYYPTTTRIPVLLLLLLSGGWWCSNLYWMLFPEQPRECASKWAVSIQDSKAPADRSCITAAIITKQLRWNVEPTKNSNKKFLFYAKSLCNEIITVVYSKHGFFSTVVSFSTTLCAQLPFFYWVGMDGMAAQEQKLPQVVTRYSLYLSHFLQ